MKADLKFRGFKKFKARTQDIKVYFKGEYAKEVVTYGYNHALKIMPRRTGSLRRALGYKTFKNRGILTQKTPAQSRSNPRPYHMWLNGTGNTGYSRSDGSTGNINLQRFLANIRTGKPMYMELTRKAMIRKARKLAKDRVKTKQNNK